MLFCEGRNQDLSLFDTVVNRELVPNNSLPPWSCDGIFCASGEQIVCSQLVCKKKMRGIFCRPPWLPPELAQNFTNKSKLFWTVRRRKNVRGLNLSHGSSSNRANPLLAYDSRTITAGQPPLRYVVAEVSHQDQLSENPCQAQFE